MNIYWNRFGKDIDVLDLELYLHLDGWLDTALHWLSTLVLICVEIPLFALFVVPICGLYYGIQVIYTMISIDISNSNRNNHVPPTQKRWIFCRKSS